MCHITSPPLALCRESERSYLQPKCKPELKFDYKGKDLISNPDSEWSTRTFDLDLFPSGDDLSKLLDQVILKPENTSSQQGRISSYSQFEEDRPHNLNSRYLKCDLACPGFRLVQETGRTTHAEFFVDMKFGDLVVSCWKRFSDFKALANTINQRDFPYVRKNPYLNIIYTYLCDLGIDISIGVSHM